MIDLEEIFKLLEECDCNPKYIDIDKISGFSRTIEFKTKYIKCWIMWWKNISYLHIGDKYSNQFPFTKIAASNIKSLEFYTEKVYKNTFVLTLKKLDWQESK